MLDMKRLLFFVMLGVAGSVNAQQSQVELDATKQKVEENVMQPRADPMGLPGSPNRSAP